MGIMEKEMEPTIMDYIGVIQGYYPPMAPIMEIQRENKMENEMETGGYRDLRNLKSSSVTATQRRQSTNQG